MSCYTIPTQTSSTLGPNGIPLLTGFSGSTTTSATGVIGQFNDQANKKLEDDTEKEELQVFLNIVPEEESLDVESLATEYLIVDWETQILANDKYYYQIKRADGSVKHYKIFSAMLYDIDRQDVLELYSLVKERF
ncbi:hypothetical protein Tco_0500356 [Tanacetum coccineum]